MTRSLYFDCFSGASGDMLLGALLDAGAPIEELRRGLETLRVSGWKLEVTQVQQHSLGGTHAKVVIPEDAHPPHRGLSDVLEIVSSGGLPTVVRDHAGAVFTRLAEAEAHVHGTDVEHVEFHEVGAIDSIVDVVGVVLGMHLLGVSYEAVYSSGLPLGSGWIRMSHGRLPVPGPAVAELLKVAGAPTRRSPTEDIVGELTTPTGAALLTTTARFQQPAFQSVRAVGYGFGTKQLPWPNAVRVWAGEVAAPSASPFVRDSIVQIETNLDDSTPEQLGFAMERLLEGGALDVAFSALQMKKNRPGVLVRVLARPPDADRLAELLLEHTTALGVRLEPLDRLIAKRSERTVATPWGSVRVKEKQLRDRVVPAPEYEDCAAVARSAGVPLALVYEAALRAASEAAES